jgi:hypothetical protein
MELLQTCREHAHKYYGDLLLAAEKTLSDNLFELSANSSNNEDQRRFFEASQRLKDRSDAMHTKFGQQLTTIFDAFKQGDDNKPLVDQHIDAGNLSLLQRDELEDDLAISVIISKANSRNSEELWKLNQRLAVLRGGKAINDDNNPFGPALVCSAMQAAVAELAVDSKVKIQIYKHLGKIFVISFGKEIEAINKLLIGKKILPNLRFNPNPGSTATHLLKKQAEVKPNSIAAIGYCFGGAVVLNMARAGKDLKGVVSFHGLLATTNPAKPGDIIAKVAVYNGEVDPFVPAEQIAAFKTEMKGAGVDYRFVNLAGAKHGFTNPAATLSGQKFDMPLAYNKAADEASWGGMSSFLEEIFQ